MGLNLGKGTTWIICLAEFLDIHSPPKKEITKSTRVYDLLLEKVTCNWLKKMTLMIKPIYNLIW